MCLLTDDRSRKLCVYLLMTEVENLKRDMIIHQVDLNNLESKPQALTDNEHHHNGCKDHTALLALLFKQGTLSPVKQKPCKFIKEDLNQSPTL